MQSFNGFVTSTKMKNTIRVAVATQIRHQKYHKILRRTTKLLAHCEDSEVKVGDAVTIVKTKPYSKNVHFKKI